MSTRLLLWCSLKLRLRGPCDVSVSSSRVLRQQSRPFSRPPGESPPTAARAFQLCRPQYLQISFQPQRVTGEGAVPCVTGEGVVSCVTGEGAVLPDTGEGVVSGLQEVPHEQLIDTLKALVLSAVPRSHAALGPCEAEFCRRAPELDVRQLLLVADLWRCLGRSVPRYLRRLFHAIARHLPTMGPAELVQLLYIIGEGRAWPESLARPLESLLLRHLWQLQPEELSAVCLGLFKSQSRLSRAAVRTLVDHAHALGPRLSDYGMVNVMKLMRFSHLDHLPWLKALGSEVSRRAPGMEAQGLTHVVLACSALHYRDEGVLRAVATRLPHTLPLCRSKDAAKTLWAFGTLGFLPHQCPGLYPALTAVLRERRLEFQRYPEHLLTGLLGLAFVGHFPEDLLRLALSPEFVRRACESQQLELKKDLFTLDGTVRLEVPGSTLPRLSPALTAEVTARLWAFARSDLCQKPEVLEAEVLLQRLLGGEGYVRKRMILPHLRSVDLELHLDGSGRPVPISPCGPCQGLQRIAVQVGNRNQYCYRSRQLLGLHALKRRQLRLAGYRVLELPHWDWFPLLRRSQMEKLAYLHCRIFSG